MYKPKPSPYSFQSADPFLEELLNKRAASETAPYTPKPKPQPAPEPKVPGFAMKPPAESKAPEPKAPAPSPAPASAPASAPAASSSSYDLRRVAAREAHQAELAAFAQREAQGYHVDRISRRRADERLRNNLAGIDAEERMTQRKERLRQGTRDMVAENKARREARTAGAQANAAGAPAAGPSRTARPQSTQTGASVKGSDTFYGTPPDGYDLTDEQFFQTRGDTLYGTSPDGRKFFLTPGEQPVYLDGKPRPLSVARRPQEPAAPFVYQDPRRLTNETPEGRLRNAGVLTPTGEMNLEATDYGRQMRLAEERKRTDALYEQMLADDVARNPTNDPGLWDSSRRDPADPRGAGVPRSQDWETTQPWEAEKYAGVAGLLGLTEGYRAGDEAEVARRSSPIGAARRSMRQTPQRQLMDLADFVPPLPYGFR